MLERQPTHRSTPAGDIRSWQTLCGTYAVEEITSKFGLGTRYVVVQRLANGNSIIIARRKGKRKAERALWKHIRDTAKVATLRLRRKPVRKQQRTLF